MFTVYHHKNKILKNQPDIIIKSLSNRVILYKEFCVLYFLKNYSFVPKVYNFRRSSFQEERLHGREMARIDLTAENIKKLASILRDLHTLKIPSNIKRLIRNNFLKNNNYRPVLIAQKIIKKLPSKIINEFGKYIIDISEKFEQKLNKNKYKISLIHGDLSKHNIYLQDKNIFLIDWNDCRLDISSCDVSQLFYSLKFNEKQKIIFLKYYKMDYIDNSVLKFHELLLFLHDLASSNIKKQKVSKTKIAKLNLLCRNFYD